MDPDLRALGEFGLIHRIRRRAAHRSPGIIRGIGDDAAVLGLEGGGPLLLTTDMLLEGVHFQRRWGRARDVGRKAMAVNISDIAAMGGRPVHALLGLAVPPDGPDLAELEALLEGLEEEAARYGVSLVGGDTCASQSGLVLAVTLLGVLGGDCALSRSGAEPGDRLWVTGMLGGAAAGLLALEFGLRPGAPWPHDLPRPAWLGPKEEEAIQAAMTSQLTPVPRLAAGQALAGFASALIDVSDGVASDVGQLCRESGVSIRVDAESLPLHPGAVAVAQLTGRDPLDLGLRGGEDYELLFTAAEDPRPVVARAAPGLGIACIGEVSAGAAVATVTYADGRETPLTGGFDHFRAPFASNDQ
jgi:thiamine-monophosphate kinase